MTIAITIGTIKYCYNINSTQLSSIHLIELICAALTDIITVYLSTEPSTKSLVPTIDIKSASRWLWEIILNEWILY